MVIREAASFVASAAAAAAAAPLSSSSSSRPLIIVVVASAWKFDLENAIVMGVYSTIFVLYLALDYVLGFAATQAKGEQPRKK